MTPTVLPAAAAERGADDCAVFAASPPRVIWDISTPPRPRPEEERSSWPARILAGLRG